LESVKKRLSYRSAGMYSYHLRVFHAVAKYRGYARGAAREELFISQPAVSKHVQALEEEVGAKLFYQVGKQIELTEAGALVLQCDLGVAGNIADHPQLEMHPYYTDPLVLIVPPRYRLAMLSTVTLADLAQEAWVLREPGSASRHVVERALSAHQVPWQLRLA